MFRSVNRKLKFKRFQMASKIIGNGKIFPQSIANLNGIYPRYILCILYEDAKQSSRYYVT